ncbi:MAG: hypothetical protein U0165_20155 [Polyangiaceae bacterium]
MAYRILARLILGSLHLRVGSPKSRCSSASENSLPVFDGASCDSVGPSLLGVGTLGNELADTVVGVAAGAAPDGAVDADALPDASGFAASPLYERSSSASKG